jgi:hypothetical protein
MKEENDLENEPNCAMSCPTHPGPLPAGEGEWCVFILDFVIQAHFTSRRNYP